MAAERGQVGWRVRWFDAGGRSRERAVVEKGAPSRAVDDTIAHGQPLYGGQSLVSKRGKFELGFFQPEASNTSVVLWQSFDHLTDTWLPGGKLGRNKLTGEVDRLVAWRGYKDPSPSMFSLELDLRGTNQYLLNWNSSKQYWTSGNWSAADHIFTDVREMTAADPSHGFPYTFGYVDAGNESYFVYHVEDDAVVAHFRMDVAGQVKFLMWVEGAGEWQQFWSQPKEHCEVYALCGPSGVCTENALPSCSCPRGFSRRRPLEWAQGDYTSGCARDAGLRCGARDVDGGEDRFYAMANVGLPSDAQSVVAASAGDCERACIGSFSCTAYSYNGSCSMWHGDLINLRDTSGIGTATGGGGTIAIRLAASEFSSAGDRSRRLVVGLVVAGFVAAATIIAVVSIVVIRRRSRRAFKASRRVAEGSLVAFTYRDLQLATKNFSEKLGAGAFGSVFKGSLADDAAQAVAVKKLEGRLQGEKQFRAEVSTIGTVQHVNLIRLLGFCSEGTRRLLVYEHMPNGSLDRHLFGATSSHLSWEARYQVALGIARGLDYLHGKCRDCIIHCDVKPENILLDDALAPKVADFGLAKLMGRDSSRVLTTMRGTVRYLAPEWVAGTAVTAKADVFSYGMVLFEVVSGRRNARQRPDGTVDFFPAAGLLVGGGDLMGAVDGRIRGDADMAEVERACKIACWCVQDDERARPSMGTVVQVLEGLLEVSVPPIPTSFKMLANPSTKYVDFFTYLPSA
ncbi:hypothetical protein C2845_PM11G17200 [Panicum miliaceum]|uniref:Receptor-like serine/threonine-protein kinase n=1 Tax=Panicum miliaceum TaxID=4540 RepID=A0A3L6RSY0_PANMI|nr:hypothetical protein C2845_PM11G17200 [Panicum miliaceum]